ncbi:hypothetical protein JVU11DRAFT_8648 [Chiua virens]|nr:hypothetical protein JVU11DRAFT_8648 [Chiua virens]
MDAPVTMPAIQVHAMFRLNPRSSNWQWVHCLTVPLPTLSSLQLSLRPYQWIRYAIGVVVGAYGELSFKEDSLDMDYDHVPSESTTVYYRISDDERDNMFPVDPNINRTQVTSEVSTPRRGQFHDEVLSRDAVCVFTGMTMPSCDAAHLLPHSKGDEYIETYTLHRSRDPVDVVVDIDNTRNGILVNKALHPHLGTNVAVLMTPNFAIRTTDIDPTASQEEKRCTAHLFDPVLSNIFYALRQGSSVKIPNSPDSWPPGILFDAVYAGAVLHHFAAQPLRDAHRAWKSTFYKGTSRAQAEHREIISERAAQNARKIEQKDVRGQRASEHQKRGVGGDSNDDYFGFLMALPYILMPRDELEAYQREAEEKKAERERSRVTDKVLGWTREVAEASFGNANPEEPCA